MGGGGGGKRADNGEVGLARGIGGIRLSGEPGAFSSPLK